MPLCSICKRPRRPRQQASSPTNPSSAKRRTACRRRASASSARPCSQRTSAATRLYRARSPGNSTKGAARASIASAPSTSCRRRLALAPRQKALGRAAAASGSSSERRAASREARWESCPVRGVRRLRVLARFQEEVQQIEILEARLAEEIGLAGGRSARGARRRACRPRPGVCRVPPPSPGSAPGSARSDRTVRRGSRRHPRERVSSLARLPVFRDVGRHLQQVPDGRTDAVEKDAVDDRPELPPSRRPCPPLLRRA